MRYTLLTYQITEARNGRSQEDENVFTEATGNIIAARWATGASAAGQEG
jgi:hypothetical protein